MWWPPPKFTHFMPRDELAELLLERREHALERVAVELAQRVKVQALEALEQLRAKLGGGHAEARARRARVVELDLHFALLGVDAQAAGGPRRARDGPERLPLRERVEHDVIAEASAPRACRPRCRRARSSAPRRRALRARAAPRAASSRWRPPGTCAPAGTSDQVAKPLSASRILQPARSCTRARILRLSSSAAMSMTQHGESGTCAGSMRACLSRRVMVTRSELLDVPGQAALGEQLEERIRIHLLHVHDAGAASTCRSSSWRRPPWRARRSCS